MWNPAGASIRQFQMNPTDGYVKTIGYKSWSIRSSSNQVNFTYVLFYRLVGDKYIVSCHVLCWSGDFYALGVNVWDLQSAVKETPQEEKMRPLHSFNVTTNSWHDNNVDGIRDTLVDKLKIVIDDYQIRCLITWKYDFDMREMPVPMLYFMNFLKP